MTAAETGLDAVKTASEKVVHKAATWSNRRIHRKQSRSQNCETWWKTIFINKIIILPEKREKTLNKLRQVL